MPDSKEFEQTLDQLATYVEDVGDEVQEKNVSGIFSMDFQDSEYSFTGHRCTDGNSIYLVAGHQDHRFVSVLYFLSTLVNIGNQLDEETAKAVVETPPDEEQELKEEAAEVLLNRVDRPEMEALKTYAFMFIAGSSHETNIYPNEEGSFIAFHTANMIFPYEEEFGIREFYNAVTSVLAAGERGNEILSRTIHVEKDEAEPSKSELNISFSW